MAQLVDDQRDDATDAAEQRRCGQDGRLRSAAEGDEDEREDTERYERAAREDDRDWPSDDHETSVFRYLKGRGSKHRNCIDRNK